MSVKNLKEATNYILNNMKLDKLKIKIFADGAEIESIKKLNSNNFIKGFTTNPSLMKKAGVKDYKEFALRLLSESTRQANFI